MYAALCERLEVKENEDPEAVRARFDNDLSVKRWRVTLEQTDRYAGAPVDEAAPWWWAGDEEASDSFLEAMGVQL